MEREPFFTLVVATYNRAAELEACLSNLAQIEPVAECEHEVIVVDNNSGDETRTVVERAAPRFDGRLRYAFVGRQGKGHALNHGIDIARGQVLGFTDDDARVDPKWLCAAAAGLREFPRAAGFGGRVVAKWAVAVPRWISLEGPYRLHKCAISGHDLGPRPRIYKQGDPYMPLPVGVNLFVRRETFARHGGFRTDLWPGEDTELGLRLWRAGEEIVYLPEAVVVHPVDVARLSKAYFRSWAHDKGRSMFRMEALLDPATRSQPAPGIPPYLFRMALSQAAGWITAVGDPVRRFHHECQLWGLWGQMREAWRGFGGSGN